MNSASQMHNHKRSILDVIELGQTRAFVSFDPYIQLQTCKNDQICLILDTHALFLGPEAKYLKSLVLDTHNAFFFILARVL